MMDGDEEANWLLSFSLTLAILAIFGGEIHAWKRRLKKKKEREKEGVW